ncbi:MAG: GSCFA domain-containing protein, partial [Candidatus Helarchaeota archaeon]
AIEIAEYLNKNGYNVFNPELVASAEYNLIWYNTYSILYEFERAAGLFKQDVNDCWFTKKKEYQDPYRRCVFSKSKKGLFKIVNDLDNKICKYIKNSNILIITLGLVEVWVKPDGKIMCADPGYPKGRGGGLDAKFKFSNYDDNLKNMRSIMLILKEVNKKCKVILTTSPVPLGRTFMKRDHLISNTESKSILRAVCGQIEREFKNVTYYPSYEIAMNMDKSKVFKPDGRHVNPGFVKTIMKHFESIFLE